MFSFRILTWACDLKLLVAFFQMSLTCLTHSLIKKHTQKVNVENVIGATLCILLTNFFELIALLPTACYPKSYFSKEYRLYKPFTTLDSILVLAVWVIGTLHLLSFLFCQVSRETWHEWSRAKRKVFSSFFLGMYIFACLFFMLFLLWFYKCTHTLHTFRNECYSPFCILKTRSALFAIF